MTKSLEILLETRTFQCIKTAQALGLIGSTVLPIEVNLSKVEYVVEEKLTAKQKGRLHANRSLTKDLLRERKSKWNQVNSFKSQFTQR